MSKNLKYILIFAGILVLSLIISTLIFFKSCDRPIANIYVDGVCIQSIDLSEVKESYEFTVHTENGFNIVKVEPGSISVIDADCPDRVCVHTGKIGNSSAPIVCLPHKLVIKTEKTIKGRDDAPDTVSQ